ncbi:MAG: NosD domain-containing protein [Aquabacterium sp.]
MTITSLDTRESYAGDASTVNFPVPFTFYGPDEIVVYKKDAAGAITTLSRGVDYSVTGGSGATGTVIATTAPAAGVTWSIVRDTAATQQVGYGSADPFPGITHERAVDRLTAMVQELKAALLYTLRASVGESASLSTLPNAAARANLALTFDASGNATASALTAGSVAVSAAMIPVVAAATVATARNLLGGRHMLNVVTDFSADNTNGSSASAAIQAAIDSLTSGIVYLPPGTYGLATGLTMKPNVFLIGEDPLITTLVARANNVELITYTAAAFVSNFVVRRLGFSGGGYTGVRGISLDGTDSAKRISLLTIEDVYVASCARGIDLRFCANSRIEGARANVCTIGIYLDNCADTTIEGGWSQNGTDWGIYVIGAGGAFDEGLRIAGFSTNGQTKGIGVQSQDWGNLTGCSFTTCSGGPASFSNCQNWKITDCDFASGGVPTTSGLVTDAACVGLQLTNNLSVLNVFGFNMLGSDHILQGNRCLANTNVDIILTAQRCVVQGNHLASTGVATSIVELATSDYNNIYGNVINGTVTVVGVNTKFNGDNLVY